MSPQRVVADFSFDRAYDQREMLLFLQLIEIASAEEIRSVRMFRCIMLYDQGSLEPAELSGD